MYFPNYIGYHYIKAEMNVNAIFFLRKQNKAKIPLVRNVNAHTGPLQSSARHAGVQLHIILIQIMHNCNVNLNMGGLRSHGGFAIS